MRRVTRCPLSDSPAAAELPVDAAGAGHGGYSYMNLSIDYGLQQLPKEEGKSRNFNRDKAPRRLCRGDRPPLGKWLTGLDWCQG
ncbi:uncharacterized protein IUM83_16476 [Phytophthora cinnamomi]|uniref:uncharacterized protein n=1 Tax=Phytophthora cinnamomi TaxID=4785 RepID=UPI0035598FFA|nr:hypothetical protein IUM83_16476 [Phytophthora cinnamomi]